MDNAIYLKSHIRTVPDWPAPGVQFRDITPLLQDPKVFRVLIDAFVHRYMDKALRPDVVLAPFSGASPEAYAQLSRLVPEFDHQDAATVAQKG